MPGRDVYKRQVLVVHIIRLRNFDLVAHLQVPLDDLGDFKCGGRLCGKDAPLSGCSAAAKIEHLVQIRDVSLCCLLYTSLPSKSVPLSSASKDSNSMGRRLVKVMSWVIGPSVEVLTSMSRTPAWKSAPMR